MGRGVQRCSLFNRIRYQGKFTLLTTLILWAPERTATTGESSSTVTVQGNQLHVRSFFVPDFDAAVWLKYKVGLVVV